MAKQAPSPKPKAPAPPEITPARVICRVTGLGKVTADRIVQQLGDRAQNLPKLYQAKDVAGIRQLLASPNQPPAQPPPSTGTTAKE